MNTASNNGPFIDGGNLSAEINAELAQQLDCGDGVPGLTLLKQESLGFTDEKIKTAPHLTAKGFALGSTIIGQLLIAAAVAAGGSPIVGIAAATTLLLCGLTLLLADAVNQAT